MGESRPLERRKQTSLKKLFEQIATGDRSPDVISSIGSRLTRLDKQLTKPDRAELAVLADGVDLGAIASALVKAVDIDAAYTDALAATGGTEPTAEQIDDARDARLAAAVLPLASNPTLRTRIIEVRRSYEQTIDHLSADTVTAAGFSADATERAHKTINDWRQFIEDNRDELTALEILYSKPVGKRLTFAEIRELANAISRPPRAWTPEHLWEAYETLDGSKVRGNGGRVLTDLVSLVRFTLEQNSELVPWDVTVNERFDGWLTDQEGHGREFTSSQLEWLHMIRDHIAGGLSATSTDLTRQPFTTRGGLAKARSLFGDDLDPLLDELTEVLAA
jgi:type I restriction enzyme R subunit